MVLPLIYNYMLTRKCFIFLFLFILFFGMAFKRYTGRGLFLDPPTTFMHDGIWKLSLPDGVQSEKLKQEDLSRWSIFEYLSSTITLFIWRSVCNACWHFLQPSNQEGTFLVMTGMVQVLLEVIHPLYHSNYQHIQD